MRVLVVDDTLLARTMLERTLRKWGYHVDSASNSKDALQLLRKEPIQIVLTDWVMPGGDGPSLCRDIRALNLPSYTYIILVTSLEGTESASEGLEAGADDFIRKPVQLDELHARIRAGERVLALEKALQDRNDDLQNAQNLINRDLQTAAKMQEELLPASSSKYLNVTIDWLFCPSSVVSGDIFNFFRLDETHIGFYSLDVAGHGVSAAMMSFTLFRLLTTEMQRGSPLKRPLTKKPYYQIVPAAKVMAALNSQFQTNTKSWLYFTMAYGMVDTTAKTIELSQAGHPNPIYISQSQPAQFIGTGGFPIGLIEDAEYDTIVMNYLPGDRLVLYSDGITECENMNGEMFGQERLLDYLEDNRARPIKEVSKAFNEQMRIWRGCDSYEDDISMLILEMG
ncbi:MAG: SpoIIE family protein phosphatase [Methyloglobulus sp.]|nr:SpoIIE family protein phosphatase [Methyloglobulus sp.]